MANDTENRDKNSSQDDGSTDDSGTTLSSDSYVQSGLLDTRDKQLDKAHDFHLDQNMGESMEQVNANLHLGSEKPDPLQSLSDDEKDTASHNEAETDETLQVEDDSRADTGLSLSENFVSSGQRAHNPSSDETGQNGSSYDPSSNLLGSSSLGEDFSSVAVASEPVVGGYSQSVTDQVASDQDPAEDETSVPVASDLSSVTDIDDAQDVVDENAAVGSTTGIQASVDVAEGADVTYSLLDDAGGLFTIDPNTGIVSVAGALDAETAGSHDIVVLATASDGETQSETFSISIRDVDEYDVSDIQETGAAVSEISENVEGGSSTGIAVTAEDLDVSDTVSYSIDDPRFVIDENGVVSIADDAVFDAETESSVSFTVTATSTDGSESSQVFDLSVSDVDEADVSAVTDSDATANSIAEDASAGTQVGVTAFATDSDVTDSVSYTVDDARFEVAADGTVTVASGASFDAETEGSIDITVTATSTDGSTSQETFSINVSDVDEADVSAVTDSDATANSIAEDASAGTQVGVTALATDSDVTDSVSYAVDDARFEVAADGTVTVASGASFDAETEGSIDITVTATSTDGSTSQETFSINVSDVDEADVSAVTDSDATANSIAEDASAGTQVGVTALATDSDVTDSVSYSVDDARFEVAADGTVTVASGASFDAETEGSIDITVTATSTDGSTSQKTFSINVSDVDEADVSAVTDSDATANSIAEDASAGTQVGVTALATDSDVTDSVSYAVDDARFEVASDGTVTVASGASFDAETEGSIDITVTATSTDGSTSQESFSINVSDVDEADVSTVTDTDATANSIAEDATAGTQVGVTALATDADVTDSVSYSVDDARFEVATDGTVTVAAGSSFDAETEGSIDITVTATSTDGSTSQETFSINVSDIDEADVSAVTDSDATANSIAEDASAGTQVGVTALATDSDVTDSVSYSVDDARFEVAADGTVTVASGASFDAETEGSIDITVTATSTDGSTSQETFSINVSDVDEADVSTVTDSDATANSIAEDASAGTQVGVTAFATDSDVTDSVSYAVDDARFEVAADGTVTVASGASFDAETEGSIDITVTATSTDGSTSQETFSINVSDVDEADVSAVTDSDATANSIAEDASAGTQVGVTAFATDSDVTDSVSYTVDDARFEVAADGTVTVASGASFDAETEGAIDITVTATSTDGSTSQETFSINVSDVDEVDVSAVTDSDATANSIAEDASAGTQVGVTALATDSDVTDSVSYTVDDARFDVAADGTVTVASGASFDAETEGSIDITVTATSTDGSTSQETFSINVSDVDEADVSTVTDSDATANSIAEDASAGTQVGVTAFATDSDVTDSVSYAVDDARFEVAADGTVTVASGASFDAETEGSIDITVTATSTDGSTSQETFSINVSDVDEADVSAVTDSDATANSIAEDASAGTQVGVTALATDADVTDSVSYSVDDARFEVAADGTVTVASGASFDAETEGSIDITVTATSTDGSTSQETFSINVSDVDEADVSAVTDSDATANSIAEDVTAGTQVGVTALATDSDVTDSVSYSVDDARFEVAADGTVTVASGASFDAETEGSIDITVTATSTDGSTSQETFSINVSDVDEADVSAVTDSDATANSIAEDASAGTQVGVTALATDSDVTDSVSYAVDDARFEVASDGTVTVASGASFDAETEGSIDITVTATSTDGSTSQESFSINVSDVDEADVSAVTDSDATANSIAEDASAGSQVGVTALATDSDVTDSVSYSVDDSRFEVAADGTVTVASGASFDYESEPAVSLTVTATSTDGSTSQETFSINVSDVAETYQMSGNTFTDTGVSETTITGNDGADTITAHEDGSTIYSGSGDDTVHGGAGDDTVIFGEGADTVYGGGGNDFIDDQISAQPNTDANYLDGGEGNDTIYGGGGDDTIVGGEGSDSLSGEDDNDTIDGGDGNDGLYGGSGDDILEGGAGNDYLDGGSDTDTAVFSGNLVDYNITQNDNGSFTVTDTRSGSPDGTDTVWNVENFRFADGDVLAGDLVAQDIGATSDTDATSNSVAENASAGTSIGITAYANDANTSDTVSYVVDDARFEIAADGTITVASGASFDFETETSIPLTVTATSSDGSTSSETFTVSVDDIAENIQLSDGGATFTDTGVSELSITGGSGADTITAHDDGGVIDGGAGNDTIYGGAGDDTIDTGSGADYVDGGEGSDTITLDDSDGGNTNTIVDTGSNGTDTIVLGTGSGTYRIQGDFSSADGIEVIDGSSATGDQLGTKDSQANFDFTDVTLVGVDEIIGTSNDDTIVGSAGSDTISLDDGNDTAFGGAGDDTITGGDENSVSSVSEVLHWADEGSDEQSLGSSFTQNTGTMDVSVSYTNDGDATSDSFSVETDYAGYNATDETFADNSMVQFGGYAADGASRDISTTTIEFAATENSGMSDSVSNVSFRIQDIDQSSGNWQDLVTVNAFDADGNPVSVTITSTHDTVTGQTVTATDGSESYDDESGSALVSISGTVAHVEIIYTGGAAVDTQYIAVSDVHFDTIPLDVDGADVIDGGAGNDSLQGGAGSDTITGGADNDTIDGGSGSDVAIYSGNHEDYEITANDDGSYTVADTRSGTPDGTDTVSNVETFRFADGDVAAEVLTGSDVGAVSDTNGSTNSIHETDAAGTQVGITATATDADGDTVTYTLSDDRFEIDDSGVVTVADHAFFDSQVESSIDLAVTATSSDGSTSSETFTVSVDGTYDNSFTGSTYSGYFDQSSDTASHFVDGVGGNDTINTGSGDDRIEGGSVSGDDIISGGAGRDLLFGETGSDSISGGSGDDVIIGGTGSDYLSGGDGSDLFMHGLGDGSDTIQAGSGVAWTDVIDLGGGPGVTSAGEYGTDWTITVTSGSVDGVDTENGVIDLSQDTDGYIDFADGSQVIFADVEEIRW